HEGRTVGMNTKVTDWKTKVNGFCKTLAKPAKKTLAEVANRTNQKVLTTKDNNQNTERQDPPKSPKGENSLAQEVMDYFNELTGSRCAALAPFEKALSTGKSKDQCYTAEELKLVIRWAHVNWGHSFKPENRRMTRLMNTVRRPDMGRWSWKQRKPVRTKRSSSSGMKIPFEGRFTMWWNRRRPPIETEAVERQNHPGNWRE
ncbi:MAG: DNA replication protein, partial [Enterobacter hormaechei]